MLQILLFFLSFPVNHSLNSRKIPLALLLCLIPSLLSVRIPLALSRSRDTLLDLVPSTGFRGAIPRWSDITATRIN